MSRLIFIRKASELLDDDLKGGKWQKLNICC